MAEDQGKQGEEKLEFTPEGEVFGYISLDQAEVLAMRTARESPGAYGDRFRDATMVFDVVEANETEDHYRITISFRPEGEFAGKSGREQFVIEKEGIVALRQLLSLPGSAGWRRYRLAIVAIGLVVILAAAVGGVFAATGGGGNDNPAPLTAALPTRTLELPSPTPSPAPTLEPSNQTQVPGPTTAPVVIPTVVATTTPIAAPPPTVNESTLDAKGPLSKIVFMSNRDGHFQIYVMASDGSKQTNVSNNQYDEAMPSWSSDGRIIAFTSDRDGDRDIFVMNADGSSVVRMANIRGDAEHPRWSPDGSRILFNEDLDIYVVNSNGTNLRRLYSLGNDAAWSSDGSKILFRGTQDNAVHVMNSDGSDHLRLTAAPRSHIQARWSPDDRRIAFSSDRGAITGFHQEVYVMAPDGSNQTRLTDSPSSWDPAWSPDGEKIAYLSTPFGGNNIELFVMNPDGSDNINLTENAARDAGFIWSPDGNRLAFYSDRDGNLELYSINIDGSGLTRLTDNLGNDRLGDWSPADEDQTVVPATTLTLAPTPTPTLSQAVPTSDFRALLESLTPGTIITLVGTGERGFSGDGGQATRAQLFAPVALATDSKGNLFIADTGNLRIRKVDVSTTVITTVAGTGTGSGKIDGFLATEALLLAPYGIALDSESNIFIAEEPGQRVRRVDAVSGLITTVAGKGGSGRGAAGFRGDGGLATESLLSSPRGLAVDCADNLFIADTFNESVRRVDGATGIITTVVGMPNEGGIDAEIKRDPSLLDSDEGTLATSALNHVSDISLDCDGNLYIADAGNQRIFKVDAATGIIRTLVGGAGFAGFSGDGGPARLATLFSPSGVVVDSTGNLFIADQNNHRIRRVDALTGVITTVAGTGVPGFSGDGGPATGAQLTGPQSVALDSDGNLFVAESSHRIRVIASIAAPVAK